MPRLSRLTAHRSAKPHKPWRAPPSRESGFVLGSRAEAVYAVDERQLWVDCRGSIVVTRTTAIVKGFRTPAGHGRDEGRGGRRPKSLEGGNRGGFCAGDGVGLWGFSQSAWLDFSAADRNDERASTATPVLVALGAVEVVISY